MLIFNLNLTLALIHKLKIMPKQKWGASDPQNMTAVFSLLHTVMQATLL